MPTVAARPCRTPAAFLAIAVSCVFILPARAIDRNAGARIEAWLAPAIDSGFVAGCLLVAEGDEIIYEGCFGKANYELDVPNGPDTRFGIASITKGQQLVLLARLIDAGALSLDDTLARWLPEFPLADETTVEQLASHTAGVPHRVTEPDEEFVPRTAADMVALVAEKGLILEHRGEENYSSGGYAVLARVLELAGGDDWPALMQRHVFAPAGMEHTVHPEAGRLIPGRASSYRWSFAGLRNVQPRDLSFLVGAGSLFSTPHDLWRAVRFLVSGGYGSTAQEFMIGDKERLTWNGRTNAYRAFCDYDLASEQAVILCANLETGVVNRIRKELPRLLNGEDVESLPGLDELVVSKVTDAELMGFEGRFELRPGSVLNVSARDGSLYANEWELVPLGGERFFSIQDFSPVRFVRDEAGAVVRMDWGAEDDPYQIPRLGDLEG